MTRFLKPALVAASLASLAVAPPAFAKERKSGEEKLAEMLEGRVAGEPEDCIRMIGSRSLQIIDKTALVYKQGKTIWVNRPRHPESLDDDDILVIRKTGSSMDLCRLDSVTTRDRSGHFLSGVVFLQDFVPYTKVEEEKAEG